MVILTIPLVNDKVRAIVTPSCFSINLFSNLSGDLVVTLASRVHSEQVNSAC